jgi:HlyD family secretion protein
MQLDRVWAKGIPHQLAPTHMYKLQHIFGWTLLLILLGGCNSQQNITDKQSGQRASATTNQAAKKAVAKSVVALGKIEPEGEVIKLSVPNAQDSRVNNILVKEGDRVKKGRLIAILQGLDRRIADVQDAQTDVRVKTAELKKVRQGEAKKAQIFAKNAAIERLQAQLKNELPQKQAALANAQAVLSNAKYNYEQRSILGKAGALSKNNLSVALREFQVAKAVVAERQADLSQTSSTLQAEISQAQAERQELGEIRPVDIDIAQAQLAKAKILVKQRRTSLQDVQVRAPIDGQILRINTRVGEQVNTAQGIMELAQTKHMLVALEVPEIDINKITVGQSAMITGEYGGFKGKLKGRVDSIGQQVGRRAIQNANASSAGSPTGNPSNDQNARIVVVKVRIDPSDSPKVAALTNMQVRVKVNTTTDTPVSKPAASTRRSS